MGAITAPIPNITGTTGPKDINEVGPKNTISPNIIPPKNNRQKADRKSHHLIIPNLNCFQFLNILCNLNILFYLLLMGLIKALIISALCYFIIQNCWLTNKNPLDDKIKNDYLFYFMILIVFLIELFF
tara:strand:- start:4237 stop:4620 length:384 start_codon:yes stop_codon:yes gene_type:complete